MTSAAREPERVPLWSGVPPHALGDDPTRDRPWLDVFRPDPVSASGGAMLILPGGSYSFLSAKSGAEYGRWLAAAGITGVVVNFRLGSDGYRYPALIADARQALVLARECAGQWGVDADRIGVIGTSAGGHLASLMLTGAISDGEVPRPRAGVLCYAVVTLEDPLAHQETRSNFLGEDAGDRDAQRRFSSDLRADGSTPPCFVWHTLADGEVPAEHSLRFAAALDQQGVAYELHVYESGPHALGLAPGTGIHWPQDCIRWLRAHGL